MPRASVPTSTSRIHALNTHLRSFATISCFAFPGSRCASAALIIVKPLNRGFRMTVDSKLVNKEVESTIWPMPQIDIVMTYLRHATTFFLLDCFKGYGQFPLHPDSQEWCSFMTHEGRLHTKTHHSRHRRRRLRVSIGNAGGLRGTCYINAFSFGSTTY